MCQHFVFTDEIGEILAISAKALIPLRFTQSNYFELFKRNQKIIASDILLIIERTADKEVWLATWKDDKGKQRKYGRYLRYPQ